MTQAIVDGAGAVVFSLDHWAASVFADKIAELCAAIPDCPVAGVALGPDAPTVALSWEGCPYRILPCRIDHLPVDPVTQTAGAPVITVVGDTALSRRSPTDRPLAEVQAVRINSTKVEAGHRILDIAPDWMQRNLTARAAELALLYPGVKGVDLPDPERDEYLAGQAVWDAIKAIRSASNEIEAWIMGAGRTVAHLRTMADAPAWPEG